MSIYTGDRTIDGVVVIVDGAPLSSSSGVDFEWGYEGSSPLALSLAILNHHLRDAKQAEALSVPFMREVVANFANEWQISSEDIEVELPLIAHQRTAKSKA